MSINLPHLGGSLADGESVTLTLAGTSAGKVSYVAPGSSRLSPRTVDLLTTVAPPQGNNLGVARAQARVTFADKKQTEGCCDIQSGVVGFDVNFRWHLNQPDSLVDEALDYFRSIVMAPEFKSMLINGTLPA